MTHDSEQVDAVDWDELRVAAADVARSARAPYSQLHVGAAGLLDSGEVVIGCNVECASYGLTLCAECGLISAAQLRPNTRLVALSVTDESGEFLLPCGRCRQLLIEVAGPDLLLDTENGPTPMGELLPAAFTATDLPNETEST